MVIYDDAGFPERSFTSLAAHPDHLKSFLKEIQNGYFDDLLVRREARTLRKLAERRQISMSKLIDEISTIALADFDAETRFLARAALGSRKEGLRLLDL